MKEDVRENDIVEMTSDGGTLCTARVRWVEDGQAGVTYLAPENYKGGASVVLVDGLTVLRRDVGEELKDVPTEELKAAIARLRGMRFPKKLTTRKASVKKQSTKGKLEALLKEGGSALDDLIKKAVQEIQEEEER